MQMGCSYEEGLAICSLMVCTWLTVCDLIAHDPPRLRGVGGGDGCTKSGSGQLDQPADATRQR